MPDISVSPIYNEMQLIIVCARTLLDAEATKRIDQLLNHPIDWERLIELSIDHNVVPLVYTNLHRYAGERVPSTILDKMYDHVQQSVRHNLVLTGELLRLLDLFATHSIEAIPYKGPVLASEIYGDIGLRETGDLDIFIHKRDFARAKQVMLTAGYHPDERQINLPEKSYLQAHHDYPFVHEISGVIVELQWAVMKVPFEFPSHFEAWWQDSAIVSLFGREIRSLTHESRLLILCMHGSKHVWSRLTWICDIAELLRASPEIDWEKMLSRARQGGCERMLFWGLLLAQHIFDAYIPPFVVGRVKADVMANMLAQEVHEQLYSRHNLEIVHDETPFFYLRMMDRFGDRLKLCVYCYRSLWRPQQLWEMYGVQPLRHLFGG